MCADGESNGDAEELLQQEAQGYKVFCWGFALAKYPKSVVERAFCISFSGSLVVLTKFWNESGLKHTN